MLQQKLWYRWCQLQAKVIEKAKPETVVQHHREALFSPSRSFLFTLSGQKAASSPLVSGKVSVVFGPDAHSGVCSHTWRASSKTGRRCWHICFNLCKHNLPPAESSVLLCGLGWSGNQFGPSLHPPYLSFLFMQTTSSLGCFMAVFAAWWSRLCADITSS